MSSDSLGQTEEDSNAYGRQMLSLCPKGWAWLVGDCDFSGDCEHCDEPMAPIKEAERRV